MGSQCQGSGLEVIHSNSFQALRDHIEEYLVERPREDDVREEEPFADVESKEENGSEGVFLSKTPVMEMLECVDS